MKLRLLSPRELQILRGLLAGLSNKEMGRALEISPRTIEMHRANMMAELQLRSQADAIRLAVDACLEPLETKCSHGTPLVSQVEMPVNALPPAEEVSPAANATVGLTPADVLATTTDGIFILDHRDRFLYLNEIAVATIAGGRELLGECVWDVFPGARSTRAYPQMRAAVEETEPRRFDFFEPDLERWFHVSLRPVDEGLLVCFRDLTGHRDAVANSRLSDERLRSALAAAGDWSWDLDMCAGHAKIDKEFYMHLGFREGDVGSSIAEMQSLIHPEDLRAFRYELDRHVTGKCGLFLCEYRIKTKPGEWRWYLDRGRVVSWDSRTGEPLRMLGVRSHVTAVKEFQRASRDASERLALAQEHAGAGIWELDLSTRCLKLCRRSAQMLGIPEEKRDLTDVDWEAVVHPDDVEGAKAALATAVESGAQFSHRFRVLRPDGSKCTILGLGKIVADSQRRLFLGLNLDLTAMANVS
jgi:PAS domain-containing protein